MCSKIGSVFCLIRVVKVGRLKPFFRMGSSSLLHSFKFPNGTENASFFVCVFVYEKLSEHLAGAGMWVLEGWKEAGRCREVKLHNGVLIFVCLKRSACCQRRGIY